MAQARFLVRGPGSWSAVGGQGRPEAPVHLAAQAEVQDAVQERRDQRGRGRGRISFRYKTP
jgi:hypothetical protein